MVVSAFWNSGIHEVSAQQAFTSHTELLKELMSWHFYNMTFSQYTFNNGMRVMEGPSGHSLKFDGKQDYVILESPSPEKLSGLEVSALVKPNYNITSSQFTILSAQDSFSFYLKKHDLAYYAGYSVFDGSQWHVVESKTPIEATWTNVTGIFDGRSLSILVNGAMDNSEIIANPNVSPSPYPQIEFSKDPFLIAAEESSGSYTNLFSGQIDEVTVLPHLAAVGRIVISSSNATMGNITGSAPNNFTAINFTSQVRNATTPSNATSPPSGIGPIMPSNLTAVPSNLTFVPSNQTQMANLTTLPYPGSLPSLPPPSVGPATMPIIAFHFAPNSIPSSNTSGNVSYASGMDGTALRLDGTSYIFQNVPTTNSLGNLTVSAWVKPQYGNGGGVLTVLSKKDSFSLAIANDLENQSTAEFSVYDGMHWHTVSSISSIPEGWTHLSGVFNGTAISIYVNGTLESATKVSKIGISPTGQLELTPVGVLQSNEDILIGAEDRGAATPQNLFTGLIDEVALYDTSMNSVQVSSLYQSLASGKFASQASVLPPPVPMPVASLNFTEKTINPSNTFGEVQISNNGINGSSLRLQGSGFVSKNITATNQVSNLTLSAWVKPNYEEGSAEFTVLSKENEFSLSIHKTVPPARFAEFSIYDGIQWHSVESKTMIPESWTHLAATFNGSAISIYVNGTNEGTVPVSTIGITFSGELRTKTVQNIQSNASVLIGAEETRKANQITIKDLFGGEIDEVNVYNSLLSPTEIQQLYNTGSSRLSQQSQFAVPAAPINGTVPILENVTASDNVTISANATNPYNATLPTLPSNATTPVQIETSTVAPGITLSQGKTSINHPVVWTEQVVLGNQTQNMIIEMPADAQFIYLASEHGNKTNVLYDNLSNSSSRFKTSQNLSGNNTLGISDNKGLSESGLVKSRFMGTSLINVIQKTDNQTGFAVPFGRQSIPVASLTRSLPQMVQSNIPTKFLLVNGSASSYDIVYVTQAPQTIERNVSTATRFDKLVTVEQNSSLHYTNVTAFSSISEDMVKKGAHYRLYWLANGSNIDVTSDPRFHVTLLDTNNNGIPDQMQWIVPHLSLQQFEIVAQVNVINVQSYPMVGGDWTVYFNTTGTADLNITAINGTTFGSFPPSDLRFLGLSDGISSLTPTMQGNSIIIHNYSSNNTGFETSRVMTFGSHHLMFQFGNSVAYANNNAFASQVNVILPLGLVLDSNGNFFVATATDNVVKFDSAGSVQFNKTSTAASGVAVNSTGFVFVSDAQNDVIHVLDSSGNPIASFGGGNLYIPTGVAVDSSDNIYVADTGHDLVKKFSPAGTLLQTFGSGTGAAEGYFTGPMGIAVNRTGYVYVTDTGNNRIEVFKPDGGFLGSFGSTGSGSGQFNSPIGIAIDSLGNVYVADTGNDRIEKFTPAGTFLESFGSGPGIAGNQFDGPIGIAVDTSNGIYVADSNNDRISKFNPDDVGLTESLGLDDSAFHAYLSRVNLAESFSLNDSATYARMNSTVSLPESFGFNDSTINVSKSFVQDLPESMNSSDVTKGYHETITTVTESMSSSDVARGGYSGLMTIPESMNSSDVARGGYSGLMTIPESMNSSDVAGRGYAGLMTIPESMNSSDVAKGYHETITTVTESMNSSDVARGGYSGLMTIPESMNSSDSSTVSHLMAVKVTELLGVSESQTAASNLRPDQQLVDNAQTKITVTAPKPNLVIVSNTASLSTISIPSTVPVSTVDYSRITSSGTTSIATSLNITKDINGDGKPEIIVTIPATTLSGPSWDGIIKLPALNNTIALALPAPSGQVAKPNIIMEIGSPVGVTFNKAVRIQYVGQAGYHVGFFHSPPEVTEITSTCNADDQTTNDALPADGSCKINVGSDLVVWTKHFTGFATWKLGVAPAPPAPPVVAPGGGYATGVTISGAVGAAGLGGTITPNLTLYQVSYDVCNQYKTELVVGSKSQALPDVLLRTPIGIVDASVSPLQPYATLQNLTQQFITVYDAPLRPDFKSFNLLIRDANGTDYITSRVDITKCEDTISYAEIPEVGKYSPMAPKVFDVRFQVGNQSEAPAANATTQYVSNETISLSGIIYSPTPVDRSEIRFVQAGQNETGYAAARMNVSATNMSNIYVVSASIPRSQMPEPGMTYWIWARNTDQITAESDRYSIGVMPTFAINGTVGFEMNQNVAEGSVQSPTIYVQNNANGTMFGTVSLVVNGTVVSSYANQLFDRGTSALQLDWTVPRTLAAMSYPVQVQAQFYNTTITSGISNIDTYPITMSVPLSSLTSIQDVIGTDGSHTASPHMMYSSFYNTGNLTFTVMAPDGTCLIGPTGCLVSNSTYSQSARFVTVNAGNQSYDIQYPGTQSPIQRFTVTSSDPLVGPWKITIQKDGIEQASLEGTTMLKVKFLREPAPLVSVLPP